MTLCEIGMIICSSISVSVSVEGAALTTTPNVYLTSLEVAYDDCI